MAAVSRSLKAMAKDFFCPVICLAQLSRAVKTRENKQPGLCSGAQRTGSDDAGDDCGMRVVSSA
ncbi:DnaB-like helicase C-terminal domain-containing protein [Domibacillus sp. A3M-37]|uniref:DnaB-like helicase C-terminal domain-containing protein n=1 Tax=Domibacillus sp. A3M-37 TaxID=2962037 RepID=UPI0035BFFDBC